MTTAPNTTKHEEDVAAFKLFLFFSALLIGLIAAGVLQALPRLGLRSTAARCVKQSRSAV